MFDDNVCRVLLYVFVQFLKNPGFMVITINPHLAAEDIGISYETYEACSAILTKQTILTRDIQNDQERWQFVLI